MSGRRYIAVAVRRRDCIRLVLVYYPIVGIVWVAETHQSVPAVEMRAS